MFVSDIVLVQDEFEIEINCSTTRSNTYSIIASYHWTLTAVSVGDSLSL